MLYIYRRKSGLVHTSVLESLQWLVHGHATLSKIYLPEEQTRMLGAYYPDVAGKPQLPQDRFCKCSNMPEDCSIGESKGMSGNGLEEKRRHRNEMKRNYSWKAGCRAECRKRA